MTQVLTEDQAFFDYLEHHGVKGMKWGQRRTARLQKRLDRTDRVAKGTASKGDKIKTALAQGVYTQKGAKRVLLRGAREQAKMLDGKKKATQILLKANGIRAKELNFHQGDPKNLPPESKAAKAGRAAAVGILAAYAAKQVINSKR